MTQKQIIKKSKIGWVLSDDSVIAFDKLQATMYQLYEFSTKQPIEAFREAVLKSGPDEFNSWADILDYVSKKGIMGYGTRVRREWLEP